MIEDFSFVLGTEIGRFFDKFSGCLRAIKSVIASIARNFGNPKQRAANV